MTTSKGAPTARARVWRSRLSATIQMLAVAFFCWHLSPLDSQTLLTTTTDYIRSSALGPYDRLVFSHLHQQPFEVCTDADAAHQRVLERIENRLPAIQRSSRFEVVRLYRLARVFNAESISFYTSGCPGKWSYYYSYVDYQSWLLKVAPSIWLLEDWHKSEIVVSAMLIVASWLGLVSLFYLAKCVTNSSTVGFVSLFAIWYGLATFGDSMTGVDLRLNALVSLALIGPAVLLCEPIWQRFQRRSPAARLFVEAVLAAAIGSVSLLLLFPRLAPTRFDAMIVAGSILAVGVLRRNVTIVRRGVLVCVAIIAIQSPYQRFSSTLMGPVSAVNTANSEEYKLANIVQYLGERPAHFGTFTLDFNNTWIQDQDYYVRRLSPVYSLHSTYPAWGRRFLKETILHHPMELPNAWWKRLFVQIAFHGDLSYGMYGAHQKRGIALFWSGITLMVIVVMHGRSSATVWPLIALIVWEVFGLYTFLALLHVHVAYTLKGIILLWCAMPCLATLVVRQALRAARQRRLPREGRSRSRRHLLPVAAWTVAATALCSPWIIRECRKEIHVTNVWRAVHVATAFPDAYLSPEQLVREIDAIHALGGEAPGTVHMYGAWALFGYGERQSYYRRVVGEQAVAPSGEISALALGLYRRALAEGPENPHFYTYARYFQDPQWQDVFRTALDRFPTHPYSTMMLSMLLENAELTPDQIARYRMLYDASVRTLLHESEPYRPGFRPVPVLSGRHAFKTTEEGVVAEVAADEPTWLEPVATFNSDRMTIGAFVHVIAGELHGFVVDERGLRINQLPLMQVSDGSGYRAWRVTVPHGVQSIQVEFRAGDHGARFVTRDLYPMAENPRWFRNPSARP